jgi:hypothetical protein
MPLLTAINELIDVHTLRVHAAKKRVPWLVMLLLVMCSLLSMGMIGYGCGLEDRRRALLTLSLAMLIGSSLWITYDLDHPRRGLLRLSDEALRELKLGD